MKLYNRFHPVSYTHLDVYKRQDKQFIFLIQDECYCGGRRIEIIDKAAICTFFRFLVVDLKMRGTTFRAI